MKDLTETIWKVFNKINYCHHRVIERKFLSNKNIFILNNLVLRFIFTLKMVALKLLNRHLFWILFHILMKFHFTNLLYKVNVFIRVLFQYEPKSLSLDHDCWMLPTSPVHSSLTLIMINVLLFPIHGEWGDY